MSIFDGNQQFYSLGLKFVLFTIFTFLAIFHQFYVFFKTQEKWLWMIFVKSIFRNQFLWNHSNASWQISFLLWRNASFQKDGNASFEISREVWCEQIYWWGAALAAAAVILRHGSAPTTFNRLALSLKIIRPAISYEIFDQQFCSVKPSDQQ